MAAEPLPGPVPADVLHVVDGDTIGVRAHIWPGQYVEIRVRLRGVDAPELRRAGCEAERVLGEAAARFTGDWLSDQDGFIRIRLRQIGLGSFAGRVIANVEREDGADLSQALMEAGLAVEYRAPKPWCGPQAPP